MVGFVFKFGSKVWWGALEVKEELLNIGALIIRIGFWGPLYYNTPKIM